ncbi:MBG domain-containing protein [Nakamurella lactea]|uniref:MBG domain-containing protein n=1 Tax=Nakamurella lactea TaxID=459515 RepID=UPI00137870D7|nr:MBG domain-containing protein [Nakamurella lactea]
MAPIDSRRRGSAVPTTDRAGGHRARSGWSARLRPGITLTGAAALALAGLLVAPTAASAAATGTVTLSADPALGQALQGPTGGGTQFQVHLPGFPFTGPDYTGAIDGTYYALVAGAIQAWRIDMPAPAVSLPGPGITQMASADSIPASQFSVSPTGSVYALQGFTGRVLAMGQGGRGQLGNGTYSSSSPWVDVALPDPQATGQTYVAIAAGDYTGYALDAAGNVYAWGYLLGGDSQHGTSTVPVKIDIPDGARFTRMYADGLDWYGWTAGGALYNWRQDVSWAGDPLRPAIYGEILPVGPGAAFTPPAPGPVPSGIVKNVIFEGTNHAAGQVTTTAGTATVTTPGFDGHCGPFDVRVDYTFGGVAASGTITDGFTINTPCAPTAVSAVAGNGRATVSFSPPPSMPGVAPVTSYTVTTNPLWDGVQTSMPPTVTKTGPASPIVVDGLVNGQSYQVSVAASNVNGAGSTSDQFNTQGFLSVKPLAELAGGELTLTGIPSSLTYGDNGFTLGATGGSGTGAVSYSVPANNGVLSANSSTGAVSVLGAGTVQVTVSKAASPGALRESVTVGIIVAKRLVNVIGLDVTLRAGVDATTYDYPSVLYPPLVGSDTMDLLWGVGWHFSAGTGSFLPGQCRRIGMSGGNESVLSASPNYTVAFYQGTACIAEPQAALSITGVPASVSVGDAPFTLGTSGGSSTGADSFKVPVNNGVLAVDSATGVVTILGPGRVPVIAVRLADSTYGPVSAVRWITVGQTKQDQAPLSLTGVPASVTYGDSGFTLGTSGGSGAGAVSYSVPADNGVLSVNAATGAVSVVGAGTVTVSVTKAASGNYDAAAAAAQITVAARAITVTADNRTKAFGADAPSLTYTVSPALVGADVLTGSLKYSGSDVGSYPIVQDQPFGNADYAFTFVPGTMTITQTAAAQAAIDSVTSLPPAVTSAADADLVAAATKALDALGAAERGQIPAAVLDAVRQAQAAAGLVNHADPVNAVNVTGAALPWNVRLVVGPVASADDRYAVVEGGVADGRDLLALYDLSFTDTLTGQQWQPGEGESVTVALSQVSVAGRTDIAVVHQNVDGTLDTLPATATDGTVTFTTSVFGPYGVTATALIRTVTFDANGATQRSMTPQSANVATALAANTFKRPSYTFTGWNTAADGCGTAYAPDASYSFKADVTLYAQWRKNGNGPTTPAGYGCS